MKTKDTKRSKHHRSSGGGTSLMGACLFGMGGGFISLTALLLLSAFICSFSKDPSRLFTPLGLACSAISYLTAGFISARKHPPAPASGALSGLIFAISLFIVSLFVSKNLSAGFSLPIDLLLRALFVGVSVLGGILAQNLSSAKRRRRRR